MFRKLLLFVLSSVMIPSVAAAQSRSDFAVGGLGVYNRVEEVGWRLRIQR